MTIQPIAYMRPALDADDQPCFAQCSQHDVGAFPVYADGAPLTDATDALLTAAQDVDRAQDTGRPDRTRQAQTQLRAAIRTLLRIYKASQA